MELNEYFKNRKKISNIEQHKMIFIFNALENGWTIKKKMKNIFLKGNIITKRRFFPKIF